MAFNYINSEHKIQFSLSTKAHYIIKEDMLKFSVSKKTTFLNEIISSFKEDANASISIALDRISSDLEDYISEVQLTSEIKQQIIDKIHQKFIQEQKNKSNQWDNKERFVLRINDSNYAFLVGEDGSIGECNEHKYYESVSQYIRALIEEYCELDFLSREKIYYKKYFEEIEKAISLKQQLKIKTKNGKYINFNPFSIQTDNLNMYHYLVGINTNSDVNENQYPNIQSYRISFFKDVRCTKKNIYFSKDKTKEINQLIIDKGCQFISSPLINAKVKLTDNGVNFYNTQFHLRPTYTKAYFEKDNNILFFECTESQLLFYFFKFGSDAVVLEPINLAQKFAQKYEDAISNYTINKP